MELIAGIGIIVSIIIIVLTYSPQSTKLRNKIRSIIVYAGPFYFAIYNLMMLSGFLYLFVVSLETINIPRHYMILTSLILNAIGFICWASKATRGKDIYISKGVYLEDDQAIQNELRTAKYIKYYWLMSLIINMAFMLTVGFLGSAIISQGLVLWWMIILPVALAGLGILMFMYGFLLGMLPILIGYISIIRSGNRLFNMMKNNKDLKSNMKYLLLIPLYNYSILKNLINIAEVSKNCKETAQEIMGVKND